MLTRQLEAPAENDAEEMAVDETAGASRLFGAFAAAADGEGQGGGSRGEADAVVGLHTWITQQTRGE